MEQTDQIRPDEEGLDIDALLRANVARVFSERDPQRRIVAMAELWSPDPVLYEHDAAFAGAQAISAHLDQLHARLPVDTVFEPAGPAVGHHGAAMIKWKAHVPGHPVHTTGIDMAFVKEGR